MWSGNDEGIIPNESSITCGDWTHRLCGRCPYDKWWVWPSLWLLKLELMGTVGRRCSWYDGKTDIGRFVIKLSGYHRAWMPLTIGWQKSETVSCPLNADGLSRSVSTDQLCKWYGPFSPNHWKLGTALENLESMRPSPYKLKPWWPGSPFKTRLYPSDYHCREIIQRLEKAPHRYKTSTPTLKDVITT